MDYSFQLYCARNFPPVSAILPRLKALGYAQVEGFGGLFSRSRRPSPQRSRRAA